MTDLTLHLDSKASKAINDLMNFYNVSSKAELISKAIAVLKIAAHVNKENGELFARKGEKETKIVVK